MAFKLMEGGRRVGSDAIAKQSIFQSTVAPIALIAGAIHSAIGSER